MSTMKMTLVGMSNYMSSKGLDLFSNLRVPESVNKDELINKILMDGGEFEVLYSDPYFIQTIIGTWSKINERTFQKWVEALSVEYNPLDNYDRYEEWTDNSDGHNWNKDKSTNKNTLSSQTESEGSTTDTSSGTANSTSTDKVSTFNSQTLWDDKQNLGNSTTTGNASSESESTDRTSTTSNATADNSGDRWNKDVNTHTGHLHGNIGVTTSQQMLQSELDIAKWSLYQHITDMFLQEFCIMVYI